MKIIKIYKRFACWIGWHSHMSKYEYVGFDGTSARCRCPWCGYVGMVDSQGNLF